MHFSRLTLLELITLAVFGQEHKFRLSVPSFCYSKYLSSYLVFKQLQSMFIPPYENQTFTNTFILGG